MNHKKIFITLLVLFAFFISSAQNWDIDLAKDINPQNPDSRVWKSISSSTYFISAAIPICMMGTGMVKKDAVMKKRSVELFKAVILELAVSELMKTAINRQRPGEKYPGEIFPYKTIYGRSFPSGHSSLTFSEAASISLQYQKWYISVPAYTWAALVGYSRVYLGVHYPSDVLAGACVGIGSAYLVHWLNKKVLKHKT